MNPLRSVGSRLALALLIVVGGALAIVYLLVVPSLSNSLLTSEFQDLRRTIVKVEAQPRTAPLFPSNYWMQDEAEKVTGTSIRVVLFSPAPMLEPIADSDPNGSADVQNDPLVGSAAVTSGIVSSEISRQGSEYAEVAQALGPGQDILLLSTSLRSDVEATSVVRRRLIVAGILATLFAIVLGYTLATLFARRIRRLESAVERIAQGRFDEMVHDPAPDELGQLARAFEQMRQRLASLDRARAEFIANASHELRTPLFSLAGFLELLTGEDVLDVQTRDDFLGAMREQVSRLTRLATVLLDLSRLDAGHLTVVEEHVDYESVAKALASDFGPRAATTGHELELIPSGEVAVVADEARVLQIGGILVENAIVHTPPGSRIEISVGVRGGRGTLEVGDDGPGIPESALRSVFDRFYRLGGSVASGSGLGLAIARELAELMGGKVELVSARGRTSFTLILPLAAELALPPVELAREG